MNLQSCFKVVRSHLARFVHRSLRFLVVRCAGAGRDRMDRMRMGRGRDKDGKWTGRILVLAMASSSTSTPPAWGIDAASGVGPITMAILVCGDARWLKER